MPHAPSRCLDADCRRGGRRDARRAGAAAAAQRPRRRRSSRARSRTTITRRGGRAAALRRARLHRAVARRRNRVDAARTIAQVLWDDLTFEREFALIPRDTYATIPAGHVDRRRAVRSLARAGRRRRHHRHGAEDRRPASASRCGCSTCAAAPVGVRPRNTRVGARTRGCTRTRSPTRSTSSSAALRGVARTKLTFNSDRDGERMARHGREPRRQGDLHRGLRRREPAARHDRTDR